MSNGYAIFAKEGTYNTAPASGWREIEVKTDGHKTKREPLIYSGIRQRRAAPAASGRRMIDKGAEGSIEVGAFANGLGIFLRAGASTASSALVGGSSVAYKQTYTWTAAGVPVANSFSSEFWRDRRDGTLDVFTYTGGKVTTVELSSDLDAHVMWKLGVNYAHGKRTSPAPTRTPTLVTPDFIYAWPDGTHTLTPSGGSPTDLGISSYSVTLPNELDTEDYQLKASAPKATPTVKAQREPSGSLSWRYDDPAYYDGFLAGQQFSLVSVWQSTDYIDSDEEIYASMTVTIPCIEFSGDDPELSDDRTMQTLPFSILDDGANPAVKVEIVTTDTDY